jgi:hypothetical protein
MRNVHEVLQEKKSAVERLRQEVEALRLVAPLLTEEGDSRWNIPARTVAGNTAESAASIPSRGTENFPVKKTARGTQAVATEAKFTRAIKLSQQLRRIAAPLLGISRT